MRITRNLLKAGVLLLTGASWCSACLAAATTSEAKAAIVPQVLNVVLVEVNTAPDAGQGKMVLNDWQYWSSRAGKLIGNLESGFRFTRATKDVKEAEASLFAVAAQAKGLDDTEGLAPVVKELNRICEVTQRPSFLIVWLPGEGLVFLVLQDTAELPASLAFAICSRMFECPSTPTVLGLAQTSYTAPPCMLSTEMPAASLDGLLASGKAEKVQHCLGACQAQIVMRSDALLKLSGAKPVGYDLLDTRWQKVLDDPSQWNVNRFISDLRGQPTEVIDRYVNKAYDYGPEHPVWAEKFFAGTENVMNWNRPTGPAEWWFRGPEIGLGPLGEFKYNDSFQLDVTRGNFDVASKFKLPEPSGILFEPKLVIVIDKEGPTAELAAKAVQAVKENGGTFSHEGKEYTAVKTPGTAGLFRVAAGRFTLAHTDLTLNNALLDMGLARFYDSASGNEPDLGLCWSFLPYSLEFDQAAEIPSVKAKAALKPVLVDHECGTRLPYSLIMPKSTEKQQKTDQAPVARYRKGYSSLQPDLAMRADGGYIATFAHGLQVAFDAAGRIQWTGISDKVRNEYVFNANQLVEIRGLAGRIVLAYDKDTKRLVGAKASDDRDVKYGTDAQGRLTSASGGESGDFQFTYGQDGRLATVHVAAHEELTLITENTYDQSGRMLTRRTPQGSWRFAYDDTLGLLAITDRAGKQNQYYYDANERLIAYGSDKAKMTLLNYDISGRILQVAMASLADEPAKGKRPKFVVDRLIAPAVRVDQEQPAEKNNQ
ncbi:MAG TPA: hypothetical protein VM223_14215 [Planctomycetota bacterium]|nr:hypothetical protein [Planctomycetota bacterium]